MINASSCLPSDIQNAVDSAKTGDMVQLPACTNASWSGTVNVSKGITIAGAGETETRLIKPSSQTTAMFYIDCLGGSIGVFEFYGITLEGRGDENTLDQGLDLRNGCQDFVIHDSAFHKFGAQGIQVRDSAIDFNSSGVIYNCKFINNYRPQRGYGVHVVGDKNYPATFQYGTKNAVFVEDSYFEGNRHAIASNNSSQYVFRHNTMVDNRENAAMIDAHGMTGFWPHGSRSYEIYNNTIVNSIRRFAGVGMRGGDGVIFNNTMSGTMHAILLTDDSSKKLGCTTYPCPDQIRDLYIWNNTHDGTSANITIWKDIDKVLIQEGRDYFLFARPAYTPYQYPHPLRVRSDDTEAPATPTGLRILSAP